MTKTKTLTIALTITASLFAGVALADKKAAPPTNRTAATLAEVEGSLGFVPAFMRSMPDAVLPGAWDQIKSLEMNPNTALDGKTKELIGLAVAAQIPCEYCIYFHTKAAKANGATDQMISEAIGMAALTRAGSTVLHGTQSDYAQYRKDVDRIFSTPARK